MRYVTLKLYQTYGVTKLLIIKAAAAWQYDLGRQDMPSGGRQSRRADLRLCAAALPKRQTDDMHASTILNLVLRPV